MKISKNLLLCSVLTASVSNLSAETVDLDKLSVTATKVERATQKVSNSIDVISKEEIENKQMTNLEDAIKHTTGLVAENINGGYDVSIYIRGSGIANKKYGTREIMLLKDGIPMTDPLGYSDLASIDTQDIEQVEITKGPGSIYSSGTTGGVMQILTKSVFDENDNRVKLSLGEHDNQLANISIGGALNDNHFLRVNATKKDIDNSWNAFSKYDSDQVALKYGYMGNNDNTLEIDLNYSDVDNWLPQSIDDETNLQEFKNTGKVQESWFTKGETKEIYKEAKSINIRYTHPLNDSTTLKPRAYYTIEDSLTHMSGIGHSPDKKNYGADIEINNTHKLFDLDSELVTGVTYRVSDDQSKTYSFVGNTHTLGGTRDGLLALKNDLAEEDKVKNKMLGFYLQETVKTTDKLTMDFNFRYDKQDVSIYNNELLSYSYRFKTFGATGSGAGVTDTSKKLDVYAFKLGGTYTLRETTNLYGLISQGDQAPHDSQFIHNPDLKPSESRNYEIGLKERNAKYSYDMALFYNIVKDEIVNTSTTTDPHAAANAGRTKKIGLEFAGDYKITDSFTIGASYTYSHYKYNNLTANISNGMGGYNTVDYSNNEFKLIPRHMYSLRAEYNKDNYIVRVDTKSKGTYYTNNDNTIKNGGYDFVTDLMGNYKFDQNNSLTLSIYNLFDQKYVAQQEGSDYDVGAPRSAMLTYKYTF